MMSAGFIKDTGVPAAELGPHFWSHHSECLNQKVGESVILHRDGQDKGNDFRPRCRKINFFLKRRQIFVCFQFL
jgi:hypothetical protein